MIVENITGLTELLGEANVERVKNSIADLIIERVQLDLDDFTQCFIDMDDYGEFLEGIIKECRKEVKAIVKKKLLDEALNKSETTIWKG